MKLFSSGSIPAPPARGMRRQLALLLLVTLGPALSGCGKKPRPLPPVTTPSAEASREAPSDRAAWPAPELDLLIEPSSIGPGESALLSWSARNADRVVIEPAIGPVETTGRVKVFPDSTTTWSVTAEGPGGSVTRQVTVEVRSSGAALSGPDVSQEELTRIAPEEEFATAVKPVFFAFDRADLDDQARLTLDANARWLLRPENRGIKVVIEGHADARGSEEYNLALGDKRAAVTKEYLVGRGVDPSRLITVSLGEERPIDPRETEEGYAQNRRAHFVILAERP